MKVIIQLSTALFSHQAALQRVGELLLRSGGDRYGLLFPETQQAAMALLLQALGNQPECRSYAPGQGKLAAARWAAEQQAARVEQWTLVQGLYTADPQLLPAARIIERLSYQEAQELASAGTGLLDRPALALLAAHNIPLLIRSVFEHAPEGGTLIDAVGSERRVKALTSISGVALLSLSGLAFAGLAGVDARAFSALAGAGISVKLVSQASSERSLGLVVAGRDAAAARQALEAAFADMEGTTVSVIEKLTILNIIGRHNYALERAIYDLRRNNIWLHLIANSVEGHQISLVLDGGQERRALELVHSQLLGAFKRLNVFCFGKGLVGGTFIRQLLESRAHVRAKRRLDVRLVGLADSRRALLAPEGLDEQWPAELAASQLSSQPEEVIERLQASGLSNVVIVDNTADERLTDYYPAFVQAGFDLVASNKKGNAREQVFYDQLRSLLNRRGKQFRYETNVGAGLPLIDTLIQLHHSHDRITRIKGVFSGSMSFLFNTFSDSDQPFSTVLQLAQQQGFTEPDPREDLNGMDVARKLLILARTVDVKAELSDVRIQNLIPEHCRAAVPYEDFMAFFPQLDEHYGQLRQQLAPTEVLRYLGDLQILPDGRAQLQVALTRVPRQSPLGSIAGSDSLFEIYTEGYGDRPMVIQGAGAGAEVTARGVYSDLLRLG